MKITTITSLVLLGLGLIAMSVTVRHMPVGTMPEIDRDPLQFKRAFWNKETDSLILVRDQMWTKIDLHAATLVAKQFKYDILPRPENSFTLADFHAGEPDLPASAHFVEVPALTQESASFDYKWNGEPWHDPTTRVSPPAPLHVGLYRSHGHYAADNRTFWGSYLFAIPETREDGRFGIEFFYHPGMRTQVVWHGPILFALYGPSLFAVCLLIFCLPIPLRSVGVTVLGLVALGLHAYTSLALFFLVGYGEAWGGQGEYHKLPSTIAVTGLVIICPLILVKYAMRPALKKPAAPSQ